MREMLTGVIIGLAVGGTLGLAATLFAVLNSNKRDTRRNLRIIAAHQPEPGLVPKVCRACMQPWPCPDHKAVSTFPAERTRYYREERERIRAKQG